MAVKKEFYFPSVSGLADIHACSFLPEDKESIKAVIQIAHGMAEHLERYEKFASVLCDNGGFYILFFGSFECVCVLFI